MKRFKKINSYLHYKSLEVHVVTELSFFKKIFIATMNKKTFRTDECIKTVWLRLVFLNSYINWFVTLVWGMGWGRGGETFFNCSLIVIF